MLMPYLLKLIEQHRDHEVVKVMHALKSNDNPGLSVLVKCLVNEFGELK